MTSIDVSKYAHSPIHKATILKDYDSLKKIVEGLPRLCDTAEIHTESLSLAEEAKADAISAVIDRRDVPNRDTPLHLAVKLGDETATEMLMLAGADWSLQNEQGWSALQEAICNREEGAAKIIVRHYQPLAWAKWCRRLPRLIATMRRMRDFYMEITFNFESSVIPFISRIAPSDTYKIWKRGANLRADMTLAGFDGFRIQRSDQSILFLGDDSENGKVRPGSLCVVLHKEKEIMNALDGAGAPATEAEVQQEVAAMSQTSMFRPGIDVTQAVLLPQTTWRHQEKMEMVGSWNAKVYDMHNVVVSIKSRKVPGAMTDDEIFNSCNENETESKELDDILTEEERRQLEVALKLDSDLSNESRDGIIAQRHNCHEQIDRDVPVEEINGCRNVESKQENKRWFSGWRNRDSKQEEGRRVVPPRSSICVEEKVGQYLEASPPRTETRPGRHSVDVSMKCDEYRQGSDAKASSSSNAENGNLRKDGTRENEYKKGLRPVLWLSPDFPLRTEELLPLLDILANKVKAIRRLREMLTTKLPKGTFPVKLVEKDPEAAIVLFWKAINAGDRVDSALKDMAVVMKQQDRAEEAIEAIKSFRDRCSKQAQESLDNVLIDLYKKCGKLEEQIELLKQKLRKIYQGEAFNGKPTKTARSHGKKFQVTIKQEASRILANLGWAYMQQTNYAAAEIVYSKAQQIDPDANKACNLCVCLLKLVRFSEARAVLEDILQGKIPGSDDLKSKSRAMELLKELEPLELIKYGSSSQFFLEDVFIEGLDQLMNQQVPFRSRRLPIFEEISAYRDQLAC